MNQIDSLIAFSLPSVLFFLESSYVEISYTILRRFDHKLQSVRNAPAYTDRPGLTLGSTFCVQYRDTNKLSVTVMINNIFFHNTVVCLLWLSEAYIKHIRLIVIIDPYALGGHP